MGPLTDEEVVTPVVSVALGLCYTWNVVTDHIWDKLTWDDPKEEALKKRGAGAIPHVKTLDSSNPKARSLLCGVAAEVEPLMKRHKLKVPLLIELEPNRTTTQIGPLTSIEEMHGYNKVQKEMDWSGSVVSRRTLHIALMLRESNFPSFFRRKKAILDVMAHELAHCTYDDHGPDFQALEEQYKQELEEAKRQRVAQRLRSWSAEHQWPGKGQAAAKDTKAGKAAKQQQAPAGSTAEPNPAVRLALGVLAAAALAAADKIHPPQPKQVPAGKKERR